jgi:hypothetical protein
LLIDSQLHILEESAVYRSMVRVSFHVGHSPIILKWKCRCHQVESTFSLEFGGRAAYMETNNENNENNEA